MTEERLINVQYGMIPNGVVPGFSGNVYFYETRKCKTEEEHKKMIEPNIKKLISRYDTEYASYEETKREIVVWTPISQVTLISFRVRDSY